jgi:predicted DNA-binding ribbon-helix-helix protein
MDASFGTVRGMDEVARRELAQQHAGEVARGSGHAVEPRRLGQMVSVRLEPQLAAALREVAERRGTSVSELLRAAAVELVAGEGYCRSCFTRQ